VSALARGGRLDAWPAVLADGATAGLALSGADATVAQQVASADRGCLKSIWRLRPLLHR
jgi:hypothetical protein